MHVIAKNKKGVKNVEIHGVAKTLRIPFNLKKLRWKLCVNSIVIEMRITQPIIGTVKCFSIDLKFLKFLSKKFTPISRSVSSNNLKHKFITRGIFRSISKMINIVLLWCFKRKRIYSQRNKKKICFFLCKTSRRWPWFFVFT